MVVQINYRPLLFLLIAITMCNYLNASAIDYVGVPTDTVKNKKDKKSEKEAERLTLRNSNNRFFIKTGTVYANLNTNISFAFPDNHLIATLSLEDDFHLQSQDLFFTGSFMGRITPRSGIYFNYYGINRSEDSKTKREIIFRNDTIPINSDVKVYFNTQVVSVGYLYSVLKKPDAFLGLYFNVFFMFLDTGVSTKTYAGANDEQLKLTAPLPNFGVLADFKLNKWLYLNGNIGFFSLSTQGYGGSISSYNAELLAKPVRWLGVSLGYQEFDVNIHAPLDEVTAIVDYNFRGPLAGLTFYF